MRRGHRGHHRGPHNRGRVTISSSRHRNTRYYSSNRMRRGIFSIIISALFFKGISNMAQSNPQQAQESCRRISAIGTFVALVGAGLLVGGILIIMNNIELPMYALIMTVIGLIIVFFGCSMKSESNRVGYNCAHSNMDDNMTGNGYINSYNSTQPSQPISKTCAYCGTSNSETNNNCTSCGAGL